MSRLRIIFAGLILGLFPLLRAESKSAGVGVVRSVEWSPGDAVREGAGEFLVLLQAAAAKAASPAAGLIVVGDRHGMLRSGGERALHRLVHGGFVVVRTAPGGRVDCSPESLFVDAGSMDELRAQRTLERALATLGAVPAAINPEMPTAREQEAIRQHLGRVQAAFTTEAATPPPALR